MNLLLTALILGLYVFIWETGWATYVPLAIALILAHPAFLCSALIITAAFTLAQMFELPVLNIMPLPADGVSLVAIGISAAIAFAPRRRLVHPELIETLAEHSRLRRVVTTALVCSVMLVAFTMTLRAFAILSQGALLVLLAVIYGTIRRGLPKDPQSTSRAVAALALLTVSTGIGLLIIELGARMIIFPEGGGKNIKQPHPEYLWLYRPESSKSFVIEPDANTRERIKVEISANGIRDEFVGPKQPNEIRIALLGDSFTYGHVQKENTIDAHLEERLDRYARGVDFTVLNGGLGGSGPWQHRGVLQERILPLAPDIVIHQLYPGNDLADTLEQDPQFLRTYDPNRKAVVMALRRRALAPHFFVEDWMANHLRTYRAIRSTVGMEAVDRFLLYGSRLFPRTETAHVPATAAGLAPFEPSVTQMYPLLHEAWDRMLADIDAIREDCAAQNIAYAVYAIPCRQMVWDHEWEEYRKYGAYQRGLAHQRLGERLRERQIRHLNVYDRLLQHPDKVDLYYASDGHLNPRGNEVVAGYIADYLASSGLLDQAIKARASHAATGAR